MARMTLNLLICLFLTCPSGLARAETGPAQYALLVGSNRPGQGQQALRWAARDAERVAMALTELGGYSRDRLRVLTDPSRDELLAALESIAGRLAEHARRSEQTVFIFYYSGHARSRALNLGRDELALDELRVRLEGSGATVTLVMLDACQTGAISRVKGVEPAADFSHNSVLGLTTAGLVVMASSAASELSQESERLQGSFFTHHLVAALRGAADEDTDGRVTLSEAYRYAYNRTLVSTAATAVGRQHVTLETDLRGRGEMVLSWPATASARLSLSSELDGEVLVHRSDSASVVAEVHKAAGSSLRLALPEGEYTALVRRVDQLDRCRLDLRSRKTVALNLSECEQVPFAEVEVKGRAEGEVPLETMGFELAMGGFTGRRDTYVSTLEDFGFDPDEGLFSDWPDFHISAAVTWSPWRYVSLVATFSNLDSGTFDREMQEMSGDFRRQVFEWESYRLGIGLRASVPLARGWVVPYAQASGGLTFAFADFKDGNNSESKTHYGYHLATAAGLQMMPTIKWWRFVGLYAQAEYIYAPTIENLAGETHDVGGFSFAFGVRGAF